MNIRALSTFEIIALSCFSAFLTGLWILYLSIIRYPSNLPRVRESKGATRFTWKTRLAFLTDCKSLFTEAYEKYSKHGKTCLIPGLGFGNEVIMPTSAIRWIQSQPDRVLSTSHAVNEVDAGAYNIGEKFFFNAWPTTLVKREMNTILETIAVSLDDELKFAFDSRLGSDTEEWTELNVLETFKLVVAQGSIRTVLGLPLCRNEQFLKDKIAYTDLFFINAGAVGILPKILRPIFGTLASIPIRSRLRKIKRQWKDLFTERLALIQSPKGENEPQDLIQIMFRYAQANSPDDLNLDDMTGRLALLDVATFHQASMAITNAIFDIVVSDNEYNTIALLREEFSRVLAANGNNWTKLSISQMMKADSICRETLRVNAFANRSVFKKVMVDGLRTEDGILLPKGALLSVIAYGPHSDRDLFDNPLKFDPFRFSRIREDQTLDAKEKSNLTAVSTGPQFLPFGHGRTACPGRFFFDFEFKMILAYLVMNYDIELPAEYGGKRPESKWIAEAIFPPSDGKLRVRRRKETAS